MERSRRQSSGSISGCDSRGLGWDVGEGVGVWADMEMVEAGGWGWPGAGDQRKGAVVLSDREGVLLPATRR